MAKRPRRSLGPSPSPRVQADAEAPLVLAVDTSSAVETLAVVQGELALASVQARRPKHRGASLASTIDATLGSVGRTVQDLSAAAVVVGPGAFTGLRVGIATLEGLCSALRIPLWPLSAMDGWAWAGTTSTVGVTLDARRGEVYTALYRKMPEGLEVLRPLELETPDAWAAALADLGDVELVGDGARLHAATLARVPGVSIAAGNVLGPDLIPAALSLDPSAEGPRIIPIYMRRHDGTRM